jgi:hypothetical protein
MPVKQNFLRVKKIFAGLCMTVIMCSLTAHNVLAEEKPAADKPAAQDHAALAMKLSNPISDLISVPIKLDWDTDIGDADTDRSTYIIQPVIPFGITDKWNVVSRTIVPVYIDAESPIPGADDTTGMGDIQQSFFFSPKAPTDRGLIWGLGPALSLPTGDDGLTSDKFSIGPTFVGLVQKGPWTLGFLGSQLWSISGDDDVSDVNQTYLQPFVNYTTKIHTTFGINTESTYDREEEEWTVPINLTVAQLVEIGKRPVQFEVGYRYYADSPDDNMDWGLRFQVTFLFPE